MEDMDDFDIEEFYDGFEDAIWVEDWVEDNLEEDPYEYYGYNDYNDFYSIRNSPFYDEGLDMDQQSPEFWDDIA